jgi:hypothetical protein
MITFFDMENNRMLLTRAFDSKFPRGNTNAPANKTVAPETPNGLQIKADFLKQVIAANEAFDKKHSVKHSATPTLRR